MDDEDKIVRILKYPDSHKWRDVDAALENGGVWESGEPVRLSDPEMKPKIDDLIEKLKNNPEFARAVIQHLGIIDDSNH